MKKSFLYITAFVITFFSLVPFIVILNISLKTSQDTSSRWIPPDYLYLGNFVDSWNEANLGHALLNNCIITGATVILVVGFGALAAYPLSRFPTRFNKVIYTISISCLIVPALTILVPLYKLVLKLGGLNTYWAIILIHTTFYLPLSIFLYTGFIKTIPRELDEAALLDGCSRYSIFLRIILPLLKPVTSTVIILVGVFVWNDYQFSFFFLQRRSFQTVPVVLSQFFSQFQTHVAWVAAGCLISMIPLTVLYIFLQKYFISGLAEGAVKA
jgi:raffinose/stachyose/melibiose transport system permease protein